MRAGGGAEKGAQFERYVCRTLSHWISHGKSDGIFWRTAQSGGRATMARRRGRDASQQAGDVHAIDPLGHRLTNLYLIECKSWRDLQLDAFVLKGTGPLAKVWRQHIKLSLREGKAPMLIARHNGLPPVLIVMPGRFASAVAYRMSAPALRAVVFDFESLLRGTDPETHLVAWRKQ